MNRTVIPVSKITDYQGHKLLSNINTCITLNLKQSIFFRKVIIKFELCTAKNNCVVTERCGKAETIVTYYGISHFNICEHTYRVLNIISPKAWCHTLLVSRILHQTQSGNWQHILVNKSQSYSRTVSCVLQTWMGLQVCLWYSTRGASFYVWWICLLYTSRCV